MLRGGGGVATPAALPSTISGFHRHQVGRLLTTFSCLYVENIYLGFGRNYNTIPFFAHWIICWKIWQG